jgi:hypothetical protein
MLDASQWTAADVAFLSSLLEPIEDEPVCVVDGCSKPPKARAKSGMCSMHVARVRRHGDPGIVLVIHDPVERYWSHVEQIDGCWRWTGARNNKGYPVMHEDGGLVYAHRFSYELHVGPIPAGMVVCHRCDNPPCTKPTHLFLGTKADNSLDMVLKGRVASKLSVEQVREIRTRGAEGISHAALAEEYGVDRSNIGLILGRKSWRHVV